MRHIQAVFLKQISDTLKNKTVLIQFLLFPVLVIIMENAVKMDDMPEHFFVKMFAVMYVGMAPLACMSSIIAEEKEKNTLRVLLMSNVKPAEYLIGIGSYVFLMCMAGTAVFAAIGGYGGSDLALFIGIMAAGILLSGLTGAAIGIFSRNQMAATSVSLPVMMLLSFLPMLSMFNDTVKKAAEITYSQQLSELIHGIGTADIQVKNFIVIAVNFTLAVILFFAAYKRRGLES